MSEIKLLPCPCCGSSAEVYKQGHREYAPTYSVRCKGCRLATEDYDSEKEAADRWNTRKPMERVVEMLEQLLKEEVPCEGCPFYTAIDCYIHCDAYKLMKAIEIVKEEGGIE